MQKEFIFLSMQSQSVHWLWKPVAERFADTTFNVEPYRWTEASKAYAAHNKRSVNGCIRASNSKHWGHVWNQSTDKLVQYYLYCTIKTQEWKHSMHVWVCMFVFLLIHWLIKLLAKPGKYKCAIQNGVSYCISIPQIQNVNTTIDSKTSAPQPLLTREDLKGSVYTFSTEPPLEPGQWSVSAPKSHVTVTIIRSNTHTNQKCSVTFQEGNL